MTACRECGRELSPDTAADLCPDCAAKRPPLSSRLLTRLTLAPLTSTLIAINLIVFLVMLARGVPLVTPNGLQILAFGANYGALTLDGQWWRLFASVFVHIGIVHLLLNMWCLWEIGGLAEHIYGHWTFLALYLASGVAGGLVSVGYRPMGISAGASGAIFGVAGALITTLHYGHLPVPRESVSHTLRSLLVFAAFNIAIGFRSSHIDNGAHIGGLVCGLILGAVLARDIRHHMAGERSESARTMLFIVTALVLLAAWFGARQVQWPMLAMAKAQDAYRNGKQDDAARQLQAIIARKPQMTGPYLLLGGIYQQAKKYPEAEQTYQQLLKVDPGSAVAWEQLALIYLSSDQKEKALEAFRKVVELAPHDASSHFNLALLYQQRQECDHAVPEYQQAVKLNPQFAIAHFNLGLCQMVKKDYDGAIAAFRKASQLRPSDPEVFQWLANAYWGKGMNPEAEAAFTKAQQLRKAQKR